MNEMTKIAIKVIELECSAIEIEVHGMIAANEARLCEGHSIAYPEEAFTTAATEIRNKAAEIQTLCRRLQ